MRQEINLIAAVSENNVIGKDGKLPWHISADMRRFRELTTGNTVIMGRKTFESIGRPLPNRYNIVITSNREFVAEGCIVAHSLEEALEKARENGQGNIFIIGGGQVYEGAIGVADRLVLTRVHGLFPGDTFFPDYSEFQNELSREAREEDGLKFEFVVLER